MKKKGRVLVADDENFIRMMVKKMLVEMGHEAVGEARTGTEAVALYRELKPDMVLMDYNMPEKTGEEAMKEIIAEFPDARIVMLTSVTDIKSVEQCIELGAVSYIRKDCAQDEVKAMIAEVMEA